MWIDKSETWALARKLGGDALVDIVVEESHTCYLGERGERHDWGYGCGECPACKLRKAGWASGTRAAVRPADARARRGLRAGAVHGARSVFPGAMRRFSRPARPMKRQRRIAAQARMAAASPVDRPIAPRAP